MFAHSPRALLTGRERGTASLSFRRKANGLLDFVTEGRANAGGKPILSAGTWLNRKGKYHGFDFRQFFARLEVAPGIRLPVRKTSEAITLHHRDVFGGGIRPLLDALFVFGCGNVAHG